MPPFQNLHRIPPSDMAMFQRGPGNFFGRPRKQRLTQLYSDTKQSYESAKVVTSTKDRSVFNAGIDGKSTGDVEDNPDVLQLRGEFQIQQDRLLAWGVFWADVEASHGQSPQTYGEKGKEKVQDVEIDRKIDQAGLGDLVASVMEEIKRLLDESGRLQHPERWEEQQRLQRSRTGSSGDVSTVDKEKEASWKSYEVKTGRVLLDQLIGCIDVLYSLIDHGQGSSKHENRNESRTKSIDHVSDARSRLPIDTSDNDLQREEAEPQKSSSMPSNIHQHPLYIDFGVLQPMHDPDVDNSDVDVEPPSYYDDGYTALSNLSSTRSIYFYGDAQAHVIVDLIATTSTSMDLFRVHEPGAPNPIQSTYDLADKLSGSGLLSHDGHFKLLGFTLAGSKASSRFGLVYALPAPSDPTALHQHQTLTATIAASYDHETSMPPLENKFRLSYNIALLATGYLAHGSTHGYIRSSNIIFLHEGENEMSRHGQLGRTLRSPYMLQPIQQLVGLTTGSEPLQDTIYHHPDADEAGYGAVAAHDIYSVGLLLLEIGMWLPLRKFWKPKYNSDRHIFAERLRKTYSPKLASKCGTRYMKAVQKCLDAPAMLIDKAGSADAAEYLLEIVRDLASCCMLDDVEQPSDLDVEIFEAMIEEARMSIPMQVEELARKMKYQEKALPDLPVSPVIDSKEAVRVDSMPNVKETRKLADDKPVLRKYPDLPIPQAQLDRWNNVLMPKLQRTLSGILANSRASASVSLMMIGPSPEKAVTTVVVQCCETHTAKVHEELKFKLKSKCKLGKGWGLVVLKGQIRRSGQRKISNTNKNDVRRAGLHGNFQTRNSGGKKLRQREYQKLPGCGASIGVFKDGEHLPPVTLGGTVLVDGEPYGMSVHHMLDDVSERGSDDGYGSDSDMEDEMNMQGQDHPTRSAMTRDKAHAELDGMGTHMFAETDLPGTDSLNLSDSDFDDNDDVGSDFASDSEASTIRPDYSTFDEEGRECWFLSDSSPPDLEDDDSSSSGSEDEDMVSMGDRPGYDRYMSSFDEDDELCVTQPALDDVDEDFFPSIEDRDDDHLTSHSFGLVHASSGIRRVIRGNTKHEIDWALIKVDEDRCGFAAINPGRTSGVKSMARKAAATVSLRPNLMGVSPLDSLPNSAVKSAGRTSGPCSGRISQAMSLVKFHGRTSFSSSFTIEGGFGVPGDSGAWVWSEERNELCGHILAWADGLKVAFMAPMEVLFGDIKEQLGAEKVELVAAVLQQQRTEEAASVQKARIAKTEEPTMRHTGSVGGRKVVNEQLERARELEVALKRLSLESGRTQLSSHNQGSGHVATVPNIPNVVDSSHNGGGGGSSGMNTTRRKNPDIQMYSLHTPMLDSRASSASSGFSRKEGNSSTMTREKEIARTKKERFDSFFAAAGGGGAGGAGGECQALPMARALS